MKCFWTYLFLPREVKVPLQRNDYTRGQVDLVEKLRWPQMSHSEVEISEKQVRPVTEMDSCFVIFEEKCSHFWLKLFETLICKRITH